MTNYQNRWTKSGSSGMVLGSPYLILAFRDLPIGWHYGDGVPAVESAIAAAIVARIELIELGATVIEAFPRTDGSIVVSGMRRNDVVDITCRTVSDYDVYVEHDDQEFIDEESLSLPEVVERVRLLEWKVILRYDWFIPNITPTRVTGSIAQPALHLATVSQSSTKPAQLGAAVPSVGTYQNFMTSGFVETQ